MFAPLGRLRQGEDKMRVPFMIECKYAAEERVWLDGRVMALDEVRGSALVLVEDVAGMVLRKKVRIGHDEMMMMMPNGSWSPMKVSQAVEVQDAPVNPNRPSARGAILAEEANLTGWPLSIQLPFRERARLPFRDARRIACQPMQSKKPRVARRLEWLA